MLGIENVIKKVMFFLGVLFQLFGYISFIISNSHDPLYFFIFIVIGYFLFLIVCLTSLFSKKKARLSILYPRGDPINKTNPKYKDKQRLFILAIIFLATVLFLIFSTTMLSKAVDRTYEMPISAYKNYQEKRYILKLADAFNVEWLESGKKVVITTENEYGGNYKYISLVTIEDFKSIDLNVLYHGDCALIFNLEPRARLSWIYVDYICVKVLAYKSLPDYKLLEPPYAGLQEAHVYYIEVDKPQSIGNKNNIFQAKYSKKTLGKVILRKGKPETFILRINAKTPGIYKLSCEILVSSKSTKEKIVLTKPVEFLFDIWRDVDYFFPEKMF